MSTRPKSKDEMLVYLLSRRGHEMIAFCRLLIAGTLLLSSLAHAHSDYHHAGVSNTARVAYTNQATMMIQGTLTFKKAWVLGWAILWDTCPDNPVAYCNPADRSENYVEAGIGFNTYDKWTSKGSNRVALWYASDSNTGGTSVGTVPVGTPVTVSLTKNDGQKYVTVRWDWPGGTLSRQVPVSGWLNGPGIHPVKAEIYGGHPTVNIQFSNVSWWPEDSTQGAYLLQEAPYHVSGTLAGFTVRGP